MKIDKTYGVPVEEISCPGCGLKYGHHNTKVDRISEECSKCVSGAGYDKIDLIEASVFISEVLGYHPHNF